MQEARVLRFIPATGAVTLSMPTVATALDVSPSGLRNLIASSEDFPRRFMIGRREFVLAADLDGWIERRFAEGGKATRSKGAA